MDCPDLSGVRTKRSHLLVPSSHATVCYGGLASSVPKDRWSMWKIFSWNCPQAYKVNGPLLGFLEGTVHCITVVSEIQ